MSHFGFLGPPFLGHLNPMGAVAAELIDRGHRATWFGIAEVADLIRDRRVGFVPLGARTHPEGTLAALTAHMADPRGPKLFRVMRDMAGITDMLCTEGPGAIKAAAVDAIVCDQLEAAGGLIAAAGDLPHVSVANALLIDREPGVPPPFVGWGYDPSDWGLRRNRGCERVADTMMVAMRRVIARHAAGWRLAPRERIDQCLSPMASITQTVPGFDFPRQALPATMHSCGPLRAADGAPDIGPLLDPRRPLVFASLGTLQGGRAGVFRQIAQACTDLDLHLVIAHGGRLSAAEIASLPGRPIVRDFVPQRSLLAHAALAITNGGLNTVLDALAWGVPVIAVPIAFEQAAIGARLRRCGAGLAVPLGRLTATRLRETIRTVLGQPAFATAAARLAGEIAAAGGAAAAATVVERAASTGRPVLAAMVAARGPACREATPA